MNDIRFPNLGIVLKNVPDGITIFGFEIKFYGIIIALGFLFAYIIVAKEAKRTGQKDEDYLDLILWLIIPAIVGARLYYVLFRWDDYFGGGRSFKDTLIGVINLRNGGLAIYGGILFGILSIFLFCRRKKISVLSMLDLSASGLLIGQILGRWGNFFNREAFGRETNIFCRMGLAAADGTTIYVHPTFLYESLWNLIGLMILQFGVKRRYDGQYILFYFLWYGLGRAWIEGLRTDSLYLWNTGIRISQLLSILLSLVAGIILFIRRKQDGGLSGDL